MARKDSRLTDLAPKYILNNYELNSPSVYDKPKIRILAVLLVLVLVSVGAAPARTACAEMCCCAGAKCHEHGSDLMVGNDLGIPLADKIPGFFISAIERVPTH